MPDTEVETILREIREQVLADKEANTRQSARVGSEATDVHSSTIASNGEGLLANGLEQVVRIDAQLSTMSRAWDRLPPVVSDRRGWRAHLELWIKDHAKTAMRWFTWEQVNFNGAVHHALKDAQEAFTILEQRVANVRSELQKESEERLARLAEQQAKIDLQRAMIDQQAAELRTQVTAISSIIEELRTRVETGGRHFVTEQGQTLQQFAQEVRENNERLIAEQRACFKQLSLETSETALMLDRVRRDLEARLDKLAQRFEK